jgi:hypothetical protein
MKNGNPRSSKSLPLYACALLLSPGLFWVPQSLAQEVVYRSHEGQGAIQLGFYLQGFPTLVPIEATPVYVAPQVPANYFYLNDTFWVFADGVWLASGFYNGPWQVVDADNVPMELLQIPIQYYQQPPSYFSEWSVYEPPYWPQIFGELWFSRHSDWRHGRNDWNDHHRDSWGERRHDDDDGMRRTLNDDARPPVYMPPPKPSAQPTNNVYPTERTTNAPPERHMPVERPPPPMTSQPELKAPAAKPAENAATPKSSSTDKPHHPEERDK